MTLRLPDKWVWDFWLARDGTDYHAFYLQAPRALGDPELRHLNAAQASCRARYEPMRDRLLVKARFV